MVAMYCITTTCSRGLLDAARFIITEPLASLAIALVVVTAVVGLCVGQHRFAQAPLAFAAALLCGWLSHGRYERLVATARFPSQACAAIGLRSLEHVPPHESERATGVFWRGFGNVTWKRGHYPWPDCVMHSKHAHSSAGDDGKVDLARRRSAIAVLIPVTQHYEPAIPAWARTVQAAGLECVVGCLDHAASVCSLALQLGCECLQSNEVIRSWALRSDGTHGRHSIRTAAVRARLGLLAKLLRMRTLSAGVIMHDADLAWRSPSALIKTASFLRGMHEAGGAAPVPDFVLASNHRRKEAFDDLNFGMLWAAPGSARALNYLDCAIDSWWHAAFDAPAGSDPRSFGWWYERSQPRLIHLLEATLVEEGRASTLATTSTATTTSTSNTGRDLVPRVCVLPTAFYSTWWHATVHGNTLTPEDKIAWVEQQQNRSAKSEKPRARSPLTRVLVNSATAKAKAARGEALENAARRPVERPVRSTRRSTHDHPRDDAAARSPTHSVSEGGITRRNVTQRMRHERP